MANDTVATHVYTLSLHDALPIFGGQAEVGGQIHGALAEAPGLAKRAVALRSEEHTSELHSRQYPVRRRLAAEQKRSVRRYVFAPSTSWCGSGFAGGASNAWLAAS